MKQPKGLVLGILVVLAIGIAGYYLFGSQMSTVTPIAQTGTPKGPSTGQETTVPATIASLFTQVNNGFDSSITTVEESTFYSFSGDIQKKSWSLDLTSVFKTKADRVTFNSIMEKAGVKETNWADGMGTSVTELQIDDTICYLTNSKKVTLSCSTK